MRCSLFRSGVCLAICLGVGLLKAEDPAESFPANVVNPLRMGTAARSKPNGRWVEWRAGTRWEGGYQDGQRHGDWTGTVPEAAECYFSEPEFAEFQRPLEVTVQLNEGVPHGPVKAIDADGRPVFAWHLDQGVLEGKAVWWHPDGQVRRQVRYRAGLLDGPVTEWNEQGRVVKQETYREGRRGGSQIVWYEAGCKHTEGHSHLAGEISRDSFDVLDLQWTSTTVDEYPREERCGRWTAWHTNGQKKLEGSYVDGQPEGRYAWWHENGQKRAEGEYVAGKRHGSWRWWHENGRKQLEGEYEYGQPAGQWQAWTELGGAATVDRTLTQVPFDWDETATDSRAAKRNTPKRPTLGATEPAKAPAVSAVAKTQPVERMPAARTPPIERVPAASKPTVASNDPPIRSGLASKMIPRPSPKTSLSPSPSKPIKQPAAAIPAEPGSSQDFTLLGLLTAQPTGQPSRAAKQPRQPTLAEEMEEIAEMPPTTGSGNIVTDLFGLQPASPPRRGATKPIRR